MICACGSKVEYMDCCGRFIMQQELAATPEQLMRSRYVAYSLSNIEYIVATMAGLALQGFDVNEAREWSLSVKWLKLEILNSSLRTPEFGFVEFIAYYRYKNKKHKLHERSEFTFTNRRWLYTGIAVA